MHRDIKLCKLVGHHIPYHIQIGTEITVDQPVARSCDIAPRRLRSPGPRGIRDLLGSLTDNLQLLDYCGLNQLGAAELLLSALGELSNLTYRPANVLEVKTFVPRASQS